MLTGRVLADRFELVEQIGAGGMGVVYRALDRASGESVAIKVLREPVSKPDRFVREAKVLSETSDPGVVGYVAHGSSPEGLYLAMEWLEGEDLAACLRRGPLTAGACLALCTQVARTLSLLHSRGVFHRDLKPSNLFLVGGDIERLKVLDFGVAHVIDASLALTRTGAPLGTPAYMAPEQARGEPEIDGRVDLYALGCVLYECLSGRAAFEGPHPLAVLTKVLFDTPMPLDEVADHVPPRLRTLVARLMSRTPEQRPRSAAAVIAMLGSPDVDDTVDDNTARPSLTPEERALVAVLMVAAPPQSAEGAVQWSAFLVEVARDHGASIERLADGTSALIWRRGHSVGERALRAARAALRVRAPGLSPAISLAMGRTETAGQLLVGEVIDRAAALLSLSKGDVCVDALSAGLLPTGFVVDERASQLVLVEERSALPPGRTLLGRPSPFVGREDEIATLTRLFDRCVREPCSALALVTGEAGIGKSRVRHELGKVFAERATVWIGRGDPMRVGSPFGLVIDALRGALAIRDGDAPALQRERLASACERYVDSASRASALEFLGELLAVPAVGAPSVALETARRDPVLMGDQVRRACLAFAAGHCAEKPLVLMLEDLHWGDLATTSVVEHLRRNLRAAPFFVLALARPEVHGMFPQLVARDGDQEVRLGRLRSRACVALIRSVLGEGLDDATVDRLATHADGHVFFLEELIRCEAKTPGAHTPPTVLAMIEARLAALDPALRRVLRAASVFGQVCWVAGVARLLSLDEDTLRASLQILVDDELFTPRPQARIAGQAELVFRHNLVREAAYEMLTAEDRALGHRLAGAWLEEVGERDALSLAEHFERGGEPARAVPHLLRAAEEALEGNDYRSAVARVERALSLDPDRDTRVRLLVVQAMSARWIGDRELVVRAAGEALELTAPPTETWCEMHGMVTCGLAADGHFDRSEAHAEQLLEMLTRVAPSAALALVLLREASYFIFAGRLPLGRRMLSLYEKRLERHLVVGPLLGAFAAEARAFEACASGDLAGALTHEIEASRCFASAGDRRRRTVSSGSVGRWLGELGAHEQARAVLFEALVDAESMALYSDLALIRRNLGFVLARLGAFEEAERHLHAAIGTSRELVDVRFESPARSCLAHLHEQRGRHEDALREAREALRLASGTGAPAVPFARATLASIELARGDHERALELAEHAFASIAERPFDHGLALVRLVRARALHAVGRHAEACVALLDARDRLLAQANSFSVPEYRETFLSNVPENAHTLALAREWLDEPRA